MRNNDGNLIVAGTRRKSLGGRAFRNNIFPQSRANPRLRTFTPLKRKTAMMRRTDNDKKHIQSPGCGHTTIHSAVRRSTQERCVGMDFSQHCLSLPARRRHRQGGVARRTGDVEVEEMDNIEGIEEESRRWPSYREPALSSMNHLPERSSGAAHPQH